MLCGLLRSSYSLQGGEIGEIIGSMRDVALSRILKQSISSLSLLASSLPISYIISTEGISSAERISPLLYVVVVVMLLLILGEKFKSSSSSSEEEEKLITEQLLSPSDSIDDCVIPTIDLGIEHSLPCSVAFVM